MKLSKDFLVKISLNAILVVGILAGFWHLSATLFYYAAEIAYFAALAGMYFDPKKKKPDISKGLTIGFAGAMIAFTFTFYTSTLLGEAHLTSDGAAQSLFPHVFNMIALTWPALIAGALFHYFEFKKKPTKELLNTVFPDLVNSVLTIAFLFLVAFVSYAYVSENSTIIAVTLVLIKILIDFYIFSKRSKELAKAKGE